MLKFTYESQDDIPTGFEALYAEVNGKWILQTSKIEGISSNAKLKEFRDNNLTLTDANADLKTRLAVFDDVDIDDHNALVARRQELEDGELIKNKDIEGLVTERTKRMSEDHAKEKKRFEIAIEAEKTKNGELTTNLASVKIDNALSSEASKLDGLNPAMQDIVVMLGKKMFKMNDKNEPEAKENGEVVYGKDGLTPITITEWVGGIPDNRPELMLESDGMESNGGSKKVSGKNSDLSKARGRQKLDSAFADLVE